MVDSYRPAILLPFRASVAIPETTLLVDAGLEPGVANRARSAAHAPSKATFVFLLSGTTEAEWRNRANVMLRRVIKPSTVVWGQ